MSAVAYIRVSTDEQVKIGISLAAQEERVRAYAATTGLKLAAVIREEGVSAGTALSSRPGGEELLRLLKEREAEHVIALKLDRLFRDAEDALRQSRLWDRAGIALHIIDWGGATLNTASAMGRMFLTMSAAFAELEKNLISERTISALTHKKRHRVAYGPTPFGYDRVGDRLIECEREQAVIQMIRGWSGEHWSLHKIARELNDRGISGKAGGKWHASTVRYVLGNELHSPRRVA